MTGKMYTRVIKPFFDAKGGDLEFLIAPGPISGAASCDQPSLYMRHPTLRATLRIVAIYAVVSVAWIFFSDRLLNLIAADSIILTQLQTYKGWFFVLASSALLFFLLSREHSSRSWVESELRKSEESLRLEDLRLQALGKINRIADLALLEIADFALQEALDLTHSLQGYIAVINRPKSTLHIQTRRINNQTESFTVPLKDLDLFPESSDWATVARQRQPLIIEKPVGLPFLSVAPSKLDGLPQQLLVPVFEEGSLVGITGLSRTEEPYTEADLRQLTLLVEGFWKIVERNGIMEALRESQSRLMAAVENLPFDFWMQDENGCFVLQNETSLQTWGDLIGKQLPETQVEPDIQAVWDRNVQSASRGEVVRMEVTYPGREHLGTFFNITAPVLDGDTPRGILGINIGISMIKQRERELQALVTIAGALRSATSLEEMHEIALDQVMDLLHVEGVSLLTADRSSRDVVVELGRGSWSHLSGRSAPREGTISEKILSLGEIYWNNNFQAEDQLAFPEMKENMISAACVPLIAEQTTFGAIWIGSLFPLSENQVKLLRAIIDISANAMYRAMLNEQTEHHLQRLTILRSIDLAISASLDSRLTLNILLNQVTSQLKLDAAAIYLYDPQDRVLTYSAGRGLQAININSAKFALGEGLPGRVASERKIQIVSNLRNLEEIPSNLTEIPEEENITYIGLPLISKGDVKGVLELYSRKPIPSNPDWIDFLKAISTQAAIAIDNAVLVDQLQQSNTDLKSAYDATIEGWSRALELRDRETEGHSRRVANLTVRLCKTMGIQDEELETIRRGVLLHDIGKMAIPDKVLLKPGPLTADEWDIMKKHPQYAYELLSSIPYLRSAVDIPFAHHERWDGRGYPRGLRGYSIPLAARIFAIVDVWDALSSDRPYRSAWSIEHIHSYLLSQAGKRFDPQIVAVFLEKFLEKNLLHQQM